MTRNDHPQKREYFTTKDIRHPKITGRSWLHLSELSKRIQKVVSELPDNNLKVLDIGCGMKPYLPFFKAKADTYMGVDIDSELNAELTCMAEQLPFAKESFDVVLCTQVLEHSNEPQQVIREIHRVLKAGGTLILSTHGVWFKHTPHDYWRWTDLGLKKILIPFKNVEVHNCGGSILCFFQILNLYMSRLPFGKSPLYLVNNVLGRWLDKLYPNDRMVVSYFAIATK